MNLLNTSSTLTPGTFVVGPPTAAPQPATFTVGRTSLIHVPVATSATAESALKTLRGFRTAGRRVIWCNSTDLSREAGADLRRWGRKFVEQGGGQLVVVHGAGGRDLAIAARDSGLAIGRVIVCTDENTARNVLGDSVMDGDALLALGIPAESCYKLAERLESRFEREERVASGQSPVASARSVSALAPGC
jgi:hypothetical protein